MRILTSNTLHIKQTDKRKANNRQTDQGKIDEKHIKRTSVHERCVNETIFAKATT